MLVLLVVFQSCVLVVFLVAKFAFVGAQVPVRFFMNVEIDFLREYFIANVTLIADFVHFGEVGEQLALDRETFTALFTIHT